MFTFRVGFLAPLKLNKKERISSKGLFEGKDIFQASFDGASSFQGPSMKNEELKDLVTARKHSRGIWKEKNQQIALGYFRCFFVFLWEYSI